VTGSTGRPFVRRLRLSPVFIRAALAYWLQVFPQVASEVHHWQRRAGTIPDENLRNVALTVQRTKRDNLEGAAAFAAFAPRKHRPKVIRAQVGLQGIYDYVDTLAEQPNHDPVSNSRQLHQALCRALEPTSPHPDYYYYWKTLRLDNRYLVVMVEACRAALVGLPSLLSVGAATNRFVERIINYQALNVSTTDQEDRLKAWAMLQTPTHLDVYWWETAASAGSSLGLFALVALAADPGITPTEIEAIERAYFPWIGGLHSLLDHLIDVQEDWIHEQRNFMTLYASPQEAALRLRILTTRSVEHLGLLSNAAPHQLVLAGMVSSYLSAREAYAPGVRLMTSYVLGASGAFARAALFMHWVRRAVGWLASIAGEMQRGGVVRSRHSPLSD
jgi:tetraprenyl-beta-curcumene synthase